MRKRTIWLLIALLLLLALGISQGALGKSTSKLAECTDLAFSTEEDFLTQGPIPPDGNPIISDGDLLGSGHAVCMRNAELLRVWEEEHDLGLDAVDVIDVNRELVAFSTELNDPMKRFTEGDLLTTLGTVIPNQALLVLFQVQGDRGLDAVHFVGKIENILEFHNFAQSITRDQWLEEVSLPTELERYNIDIWFSIEGTERRAATVSILDGDLLSARHGVIVKSNQDLLPVAVPAGIPTRGVDFGLDAFTAPRDLDLVDGRFSTELLYDGEISFTDGDVLRVGGGVVIPDVDLYKPFEPKADFLGTDALFMRRLEPEHFNFLTTILHLLGR